MGKPSILQRDKATTAIGNMLLQVDGSVSPKAAYRVLLLVVVAFVASLLTSVPSVDAIVNGAEATGDSAVVALMPGYSNPHCTGVYYENYAVVTAAHCVVRQNGRRGEWRHPLAEWFVSQPGVNWKDPQASKTRVRVLRIWVPENYFNRYNPLAWPLEVETLIDDIAFLFLEKPLKGSPVSGFASSKQVDAFRAGVGTAVTLGYGCLGIPEGSGDLEPNDGKPYLVGGIAGTHRGMPPVEHLLLDRHVQVVYPIGKSICPGDSGSPLFLNQPDNKLQYVGVQFAGDGWEEARKARPQKQSVGDVTTFYPFAATFDAEYAKFLAEVVTTTTTTSPPTTTIASRDPLPERIAGTKCLKVGAKRKVGNKTLICKKVSKVLKWVA